jgi:hypothetical protein
LRDRIDGSQSPSAGISTLLTPGERRGLYADAHHAGYAGAAEVSVDGGPIRPMILRTTHIYRLVPVARALAIGELSAALDLALLQHVAVG